MLTPCEISLKRMGGGACEFNALKLLEVGIVAGTLQAWSIAAAGQSGRVIRRDDDDALTALANRLQVRMRLLDTHALESMQPFGSRWRAYHGRY